MGQLAGILSREFRLVAACCAWPPSPWRDGAVHEAAARSIDWPLLGRIAGRQRVQGLVHAALARSGAAAPAAVAEALAFRAREIAAASLAQAAESVRLQAALDRAGIANLVLKGAAVEMLAYGELGKKAAWDIDLLVAPGEVTAALRVLAETGYDLAYPRGLTSAEFAIFVSLARECELRHVKLGLNVELHWGLADHPALLRGMSVASPIQWVTLSGGMRLRTFAADELFAYLCVHGAMHGWSRLKWLADLSAMLAGESPPAVEALYRRSLELGSGLCSAQALVLSQRLLGATIGRGVEAVRSQDRGVGSLVRMAVDTMAGGGERELDARPFADARVLLTQVALGGTWRSSWTQIRHRAVSLEDRVRFPLPKQLRFLYAVVRAPLWLCRRLGLVGRRVL
jgi:hypothetical protein